MIRAILKFGASLFVNYVFYDFFRDQLKYRVMDRKRTALILLLSAAAFSVVNSFHNGLINLVFGLSIVTVQVLLIFRDDRRREVFLILVGGSVALFMELVVYLFFSKLPLWKPLWEAFRYPQEAEEYMMGILSYLLCWFVLHGLKSYFLSARYTMRQRFPLTFFVLPFATAMIYLSLFFESRGANWTEYSLNLGYVLLPMANILMFYTINRLFFVCEKNRERELVEQQTVLQQRYYKHLEEIDLGHRRYAHDLKNCMVSIGALAAAGGNKEIMDLLGDMETELDTLTGKHYTSNHVLNALFWEKEALARRHGVQLDILAEDNPQWACIPGRDLIIMAGNLLDNAVEAAEQCRGGSVRVALRAEEHFLVIEVENTCLEPSHTNEKVLSYRKRGNFLSTKPDAREHGFGILSVRDTAEKYGGLLYAGQEGDRFMAILTLAKDCLSAS